MDPQANVDLSGGFVPKAPAPPPSGGGIDLSGGFVPAGGSPAAPAAPAAPVDPLTQPLRPGKEGFYPMTSPTGETKQVAYSKVEQAIKQGHLFADRNHLAQYARDFTADPANQDDNEPWYHPMSLLTAPGRNMVHQYQGFARDMARTITAFDRPPHTQAEQNLQLFAATPNTTPGEAMGQAAETTMEYGTGEKAFEWGGLELMNLVSKYLGGAKVPIAAVAPLEKEITKGTLVGKLALNALKQGTIGGGQTYMKTGGDVGAAETSAAITAGLGLAIPGIPAAWEAMRDVIATPGQAKAAQTAAEATTAATREQTARTNAEAINRAAHAERDAAAAAATARQEAAAKNAEAINRAALAERDAAAAKTAAERRQAAANSAAAINQAALAERDAATAAAEARQKLATENAAKVNQAAQAEEAAAAAAAAARPGTAAYATAARAAARPVLEQANASRPPTYPVIMNQPGGEPGVPTRTATLAGRPPMPEIDVEGSLAKGHDFIGVSDRLEEQGQAIYNEFDRVTNGKFRAVNAEVQNARNAMYARQEGGAQAYQTALDKMDKLMDSVGDVDITPYMRAAGKAIWTQQYALRDVGDVLDRNINRVPGSTEAAGEGIDIDGRGMLRGLQRLVTLYKGRTRLDAALGGVGRLDTLEGIANANTNEAKKQIFQTAFTSVEAEVDKLMKAEAAAAKKAGPNFQFEFTTPEAELEKLNANAAPKTTKPSFKYEFTTPEEEHDKLLKAEAAAAKAGKQNFQYEFTTPEAELAKLTKADAKGPRRWTKARYVGEGTGASLAFSAGAFGGQAIGIPWFVGGNTGAGLYGATRFTMYALKTNPRIAQNFLFALDSGAQVKNFAPLIANMIAQYYASSQAGQNQPEEEPQQEEKQP